MIHKKAHGIDVIIFSFIAAFALTVFPLPNWLAVVRPEWVALVLIYWCMALPNRIGIGIAWAIGLMLDVLRIGLLGENALALCIIAYITLKLYQRLRVFPLWQQALSVFVLVSLSQMLHLWIKGITGQPIDLLTYWLPSISSMVAWPLVFTTLRALRRKFRVS
ncbi:MAG: rod shape-determining protein MreD [Thiotrichaceae bacterium]|nr:rod shape-determining protein MreD [Thiotrichaceae bacterium]